MTVSEMHPYATTDPADEHERALLGAILTGYRDIPALTRVLTGSDFYRPQHELIWDAAVKLHADGIRPDPFRVLNHLGGPAKANRLLGGATYLTDLVGEAMFGTDPLWLADRVREASVRRAVGLLGDRCKQAVTDTDIDVDELMTRVRDWTGEVASTKVGGASGISSALEQVFDIAQNGPKRGLLFPWQALNELVDGAHPGQVITFAARPGGGKSIALENFATLTARTGLWVHMASMEMSPVEITQRTMAWTAQVNLSKIRHGQDWLSESDWDALNSAAKIVQDTPLRFSAASSQTVRSIRADAWETAQEAKRHGSHLGLVVVDYVQLVQTQKLGNQTRQQQIGTITRALKAMARELEVPVVMASQLKRHDGIPTLNDLREAGDIENDSDVVVLMHPEMVEDGGKMLPTGDLDLIVAKNRNGQQGTRTVSLYGHYAAIRDAR